MTKYTELQAEHQRLLESKDRTEDSQALLQDVQAYIGKVKSEAGFVSDVRDRNQLRANLRFWASVVFDQTGLYPDTTLHPAEEAAGTEAQIKGLESTPAEKPPLYRSPWFWVSVVAGIVVIGLLLLPILNPGLNPFLPSAQEAVRLTVESEYTAVVLNITETASAMPPTTAAPTNPTPSRTAVVTPIKITPTPEGEVEALLSTQIALVTQIIPPAEIESPTPTPTEFSITGGEEMGEYVWMKAEVASMANPQGCGDRSLTLQVAPGEAFKSVSLPPARVTVSQGGKGEVLYSGALDMGGKALAIAIPERGADMLLVQVFAAGLLFDSVIVQFTPDCSHDQVTITYATSAEAAKVQKLVEAVELPPQSILLGWWLETWGPSPVWDGWVAVLRLQGSGGEGSYIYWAAGNVDASRNVPLAEDWVVVIQSGCERAFVRLGVTSGGETFTQDVSLVTSYCPAKPDVGQATPKP
ncbi:MAG: hypothetical protein JW726_11275 [Anaerolineales bacterium]|nr:hypothetical protein [Anaerolineales bacterium]